MEVDVLNARDLKCSGEYYCVVKFDRLLARTPVHKQRGASSMHRGLEWNQRLSFPVYDTSSCVVIGLFNAAKSHALVRFESNVRNACKMEISEGLQAS